MVNAKEHSMKKSKALVFMGLAAILLAFGLVLAGCGDGAGGGPTVTISGTPKVGETLTATSTGDFQSDFIWCWRFPDSTATFGIGDRGTVSGENNNTLTIVESGDYYIVAERTDSEGYLIRSNALGPVTD
jgi:hypothetical protein